MIFIATYNIRPPEQDSEKKIVLCKKGDDITRLDGTYLEDDGLVTLIFVLDGVDCAICVPIRRQELAGARAANILTNLCFAVKEDFVQSLKVGTVS